MTVTGGRVKKSENFADVIYGSHPTNNAPLPFLPSFLSCECQWRGWRRATAALLVLVLLGGPHRSAPPSANTATQKPKEAGAAASAPSQNAQTALVAPGRRRDQKCLYTPGKKNIPSMVLYSTNDVA